MIKVLNNNEQDSVKYLEKISSYKINTDIFSSTYVYIYDDKIIGFINYSIIYDRVELNYIYVLKDYRKKQIASKLIEHMLKQCLNNCIKNITLEVGKKNLTAQNLYKKYGFKNIAIRKNYYNNEDAILMMKEFDKIETDIYIRNRD